LGTTNLKQAKLELARRLTRRFNGKDAWHWFRLTEGENSPRAAEAIEHLLSPELRPALRQWHRRLGDGMNENALSFRDRRSELVGERFGWLVDTV
jgi:hypothetical protein